MKSTRAKGYILGAIAVATYGLNAARTAYHDRIRRAMVLSKYNVRYGEASGGGVTRRPDEVLYYPLYMTMFV